MNRVDEAARDGRGSEVPYVRQPPAAALAERGYDLRLVLGDGGHDPNHCGAILPDALRWLWRP